MCVCVYFHGNINMFQYTVSLFLLLTFVLISPFLSFILSASLSSQTESLVLRAEQRALCDCMPGTTLR